VCDRTALAAEAALDARARRAARRAELALAAEETEELADWMKFAAFVSAN
jgi:hypothetical protein